jgi:hypothetical protein
MSKPSFEALVETQHCDGLKAVLTNVIYAQLDCMVRLPLLGSIMSLATPQSLSFQEDFVSTNETNGTVPALPVCFLLCLLDKLGGVVSEEGICGVDSRFEGCAVS